MIFSSFLIVEELFYGVLKIEKYRGRLESTDDINVSLPPMESALAPHLVSHRRNALMAGF